MTNRGGGVVVVYIRLPDMREQARLAMQEWVQLQLGSVERARAEDGLVIVPSYNQPRAGYGSRTSEAADVKLWHRTNQQGRDGIEAEGFRHSDPDDGGPVWTADDGGKVWFADSKKVARQTCVRTGWWVWIEVPDDTPVHLHHDGKPFTGNYRLPLAYVNSLSLNFEQGD